MSEYEKVAPEFKKNLMNRMHTQNPFWSLLGMELLDVRKGWAQIKVPFSEKIVNAIGIVHGGVIFSPADSAIGVALAGLLHRDELITTVEMKINYLKPFDSGAIIAEGKIIHRGTHTAVGEAEVKDAAGNVIAKALGTYMIMKNKKSNRMQPNRLSP
jgi:uncharacterized protein (TIGR00369 family)